MDAKHGEVFFLSQGFSCKHTVGSFSIGFSKKLQFLIMFLKILRSGFIRRGAVQAHSEAYPVIEYISPGKAGKG